jgi:pilus assembly protein CpaC
MEGATGMRVELSELMFPASHRWKHLQSGVRVGWSTAVLLMLGLMQNPVAAQPPAAMMAPPMPGGALRLEEPEVTGRVDAALSPNVNQLLKPQYHLEIERHHSRLIMTNRKVRRIAVTDIEVANYVQYSENEISIVGLAVGRTDLTLWFEDELTPSIYEVTVVRDASLEEQRSIDFGRLERRLKVLYPNSSVALIPIGAQVIVRGQAYDSEEAQNILQVVRTEVLRSLRNASQAGDDMGGGLNGLGGIGLTGGAGGGVGAGGAGGGAQGRAFRDIVINELNVPGEFNISLRVVVAEINRSELRDAGVDWQVLFNNGRHSVGTGLGGASGTTLSGIFENGEINVFVKWLQSNGTIRLLAEPRLTVLSGTGASILAGGEFAVPTIIGLGGGQATTFRGFGTSLVVTPTVIDKDLIRMQVVPEFSQVNADNTVNGIPGTNVKRVQTTVELREGQTFAIGGLISNQTLTEVSRIPLLGDIPWIGPRVFQSKSASQVETELLVLVSPEIVRPMEPNEVPPLPGYNVTHPSDDELWKRGQTEGTPDHTVYQLAPFGSGQMQGIPQGYNLYNPPPAPGPYVGPGVQSYPVPQYGYGSAPVAPNAYTQPLPGSMVPGGGNTGAADGYPSQVAPGRGPEMVPPAVPQEFPGPEVPGFDGESGSGHDRGGIPVDPSAFSKQVNRTGETRSKEKPSRFSTWTNSIRRGSSSKTSVRPAGWTKER